MKTHVLITPNSITMDFDSFYRILPNDIRTLVNEFSEMTNCSLVLSIITYLRSLKDVQSASYQNGLVKVVFKQPFKVIACNG
jgi:hypothetical protein